MLPSCWEIVKCGREPGGENVEKLGVCPAYPRNGHSCWIVAGTYCGGEIQGTFAQKRVSCITCDVYKRYSTSFGAQKDEFKQACPDEFNACVEFLNQKK